MKNVLAFNAVVLSAVILSMLPATAHEISADLLKQRNVLASDIPLLFPKDPQAKTVALAENLDLAGDGLRDTYKETYAFSNFVYRPEPLNPSRPAEQTTLNRVVNFQISFQVTDSVGNPIRDANFTVEGNGSGNSNTVRTNADGRLVIADEIRYKHFEAERYVLKQMRISHASGFSKTVLSAINPWDSNRLTFARNLKNLTTATIAQANLTPKKSAQIVLKEIGMRNTSEKSDEASKHYEIMMEAKTIRPTLSPSGQTLDPLESGTYLLRYGAIDPLGKILAKGQKLVAVKSGRIQDTITLLPNGDEENIVSNNILLLEVQLFPIKEQLISAQEVQEMNAGFASDLKSPAVVKIGRLVDVRSGLKMSRPVYGQFVPSNISDKSDEMLHDFTRIRLRHL